MRAEDRPTLLAALGSWATRGVGFADAWLLARARATGQPICSVNERDFGGVPNTFRA